MEKPVSPQLFLGSYLWPAWMIKFLILQEIQVCISESGTSEHTRPIVDSLQLEELPINECQQKDSQ